MCQTRSGARQTAVPTWAKGRGPAMVPRQAMEPTLVQAPIGRDSSGLVAWIAQSETTEGCWAEA
ncbi:hypothetical protein E2562_025520 [Oryza meyeriana var. granulata]|uniref:Uncharacterized protein n=1 Tax=Oryza meyeriana var. granulata TaxID=110450 RepID=A0A6G1FC46_9ORYZ|nr:hypothetical protein E2562_025520 [Oryza meyeriana var. granulata]